MTEHEWLGLKQYLEEHDIEYRTEMVYISGQDSAFVIVLPTVTCYHNTTRELVNDYPEVTTAWEALLNELKGIPHEELDETEE